MSAPPPEAQRAARPVHAHEGRRNAPAPDPRNDDAAGQRKRRRNRRRGGSADPGPRAEPSYRSEDAPRIDDRGGAGRFEGRRGRRRDRPADGERGLAPNLNLLPERDPFTELVSVDPDERIDLEIESTGMNMRVVDIITPIGKGQRGLIVAPPKTGKTTLLMDLARSITDNHPEVELIVMLIDERPEEVTAFRRAGHGTVWASSNDEPNSKHLRLTADVIAHCKRRVLEGKDVCVLLDSITRLARAHNMGAGGHRTLSGGLDSRALERPKRFFGAARNIVDGGSLTILATALIDTGSRMDEVIFQEFKGTGNMELQLDRRLAERRVWPAIDVPRSGTRKEEKLFEPAEYEGVVAVRRALSGKPPAEAMQMLLNRLAKYKTNREFLLDCAKAAASLSL